jgi:hypothetical protein
MKLRKVVEDRVDPDLVDMVARESAMLEVELLAKLDGRLADLQMWNKHINGEPLVFRTWDILYIFLV